MACHCSGCCVGAQSGVPPVLKGKSPQRYSQPSVSGCGAATVATGTSPHRIVERIIRMCRRNAGRGTGNLPLGSVTGKYRSTISLRVQIKDSKACDVLRRRQGFTPAPPFQTHRLGLKARILAFPSILHKPAERRRQYQPGTLHLPCLPVSDNWRDLRQPLLQAGLWQARQAWHSLCLH